jgi:hypothetical protein
LAGRDEQLLITGRATGMPPLILGLGLGYGAGQHIADAGDVVGHAPAVLVARFSSSEGTSQYQKMTNDSEPIQYQTIQFR